MKVIHMRAPGAGLAAIFCLVLLSAGASAQQEAIDMHLEDVGFVMRAATPQQVERLKLLPPRRFITRTAGGRRYYLYADPDLCKCVFLGDDAAMQSYKDLVAARRQSSGLPGTVLVDEMDAGVSNSIAPGDILDY
jgi:hypothetical protein